MVRKLVDRGILRQEEVIAHWKKLSNFALPPVRINCSCHYVSFGLLALYTSVTLFSLSFQKLIENFQLKSQSIKPPLLTELQSCMDKLQVSQQTIEGAT